jgi:hypothetical protein
MASLWTNLALLVLSLLVLILISRWAIQQLGQLGYLLSGDTTAAGFLTFAILLPGIVLHEGGHWLMAKVLGLKTGKFRIWPEQRKKTLRLGYVEIERGDVWRDSLVGLAPFITGSALLLFVGYRVFDLNGLNGLTNGSVFHGLWEGFTTGLHTPDAWLWLYVAFAVSNAMTPSASDRQAWVSVLIFIGLLTGAALLIGGIPSLSTDIAAWLTRSFRALAYTFAFAITIDVLFGAALWGLSWLICWMGRSTNRT